VSHFSATVFPDVGKNFPPIKLASAEGFFVSSIENVASAWAKIFTCSHPAFSKMAAIPLAPEKAQTYPRPPKNFLKGFGFTLDPFDWTFRVAYYEVVLI
jgi:hypothetical protein